MKTKILLIILLISSIYACQDTEEVYKPYKDKLDIVFITGKDKENDNRYYYMAEEYYKTGEENYDMVITSCHSLLSIRDFLDSYKKHNIVWGKIVIVSHSNEWRGMSLPVFDKGQRTNHKILKEAIAQNRFLPLSKEVLTDTTKLIIEACGLGKNQKLLKELQRAFGIEHISASPFFTVFMKENNVAKKYKAAYYYAFFKTGYRPANIKLSKQYHQKYPDVNINWLEALSRKYPRFAGDTYSYFFNIPVKWTVVFETEEYLPVFKNEKEKLKWILSQNELMQIINKTGIEPDKFRWRIKKIQYQLPGGGTAPALEIQGKTSALCVIK